MSRKVEYTEATIAKIVAFLQGELKDWTVIG